MCSIEHFTASRLRELSKKIHSRKLSEALQRECASLNICALEPLLDI